MDFAQILNQYIEQLDCSAKNLAAASGLSSAVISRYRSGERQPELNSTQVEKLVTGITSLAREKDITAITRETVLSSFALVLDSTQYDYPTLVANLNTAISVLGINTTELSRALNFDASFLSRIRSGQRRPADTAAFIKGVCEFIVRRCTKEKDLSIIADLTETDISEITINTVRLQKLSLWLSSGITEPQDYLGDFLKALDDFDLDEYIRSIHFDELKVPTMPFQLPTTKRYYGIEEMKQGELDFFKSTVLSKSTEPVFMCSDMPMEDMAEDLEFGKKWMFAIAMTLKKGLHLNIIHNLDRPLKEMMLGLQSWIPIYMTGQVSPYYLKGVQNNVYCHFNYVSGTAALTGECINGFHNDGKYYLTNNKDEVAYYKKKTAGLLSKATPLMGIYRKNNETAFNAFLNTDAMTSGDRHNILSSLPLYTISDKILSDILKRHFLFDIDGERILAAVKKQKECTEILLQENTLLDEIPELSKEEFKKHPMIVSLSSIFYDNELAYTYDEYLEHLDLTRKYAESHEKYNIQLDKEIAFRNIQITMHNNKWVMLSKNKAPVIHFVIHHPKMIEAFNNFSAPIIEL